MVQRMGNERKNPKKKSVFLFYLIVLAIITFSIILSCTVETPVTRQVEVTKEIPVTRRYEVTREVPVTREVEITKEIEIERVVTPTPVIIEKINCESAILKIMSSFSDYAENNYNHDGSIFDMDEGMVITILVEWIKNNPDAPFMGSTFVVSCFEEIYEEYDFEGLEELLDGTHQANFIIYKNKL